MGRLIYRMCLIVVLVIAVAGGVYYYVPFMGTGRSRRKGRLYMIGSIPCRKAG